MQRRVEMHRLQDLVRLHRLSTGCREVARLLQMSPNTERQYREALETAGLLAGDATQLPELEVLKEAVRAGALRGGAMLPQRLMCRTRRTGLCSSSGAR